MGVRHVVFNRFIDNECVSCCQSPHHATLVEYTITRSPRALNNQGPDAVNIYRFNGIIHSGPRVFGNDTRTFTLQNISYCHV